MRGVKASFDILRAAYLYSCGIDTSEIASLMHVTKSCLYRYLFKAGVPKRNPQWAHGEHHWRWNGDGASYKAFHRRLHRSKGLPKCCNVCGTSDPSLFYDWANLTGRYQDLEDYERMCRPCHKYFDHYRSKGLTSVKIKAMRNERSSGKTVTDIAKELGMCRKMATDIILGRGWRHVSFLDRILEGDL